MCGVGKMIRLRKSAERWWQKPLAEVGGRPIPAELALLSLELRPGESGAWLNSRGTRTGVVDIMRTVGGKFQTVRIPLPSHVGDLLSSLYKETGLPGGASDLVIWGEASESVRFVEVKCPHWDKPSQAQTHFHDALSRRGIDVHVAEWEFESD